MALYTRCPACKSEIAFDPPKNIADLPEDYKHRIKCPSCGVTIGVKLNIIERRPIQETPMVIQPQEEPYPIQTTQYEDAKITTVPARRLDAPAKNAKKNGTSRNIMMMLISLLIIALNVVSYLVGKGSIKIDADYGLTYCDGIGWWELLVKDTDAFKGIFTDLGTANGVFGIMPMIFFTLAFVTFFIALFSVCLKKYGRVLNLILAIVVIVVGIMVIFSPYAILRGATEEAVSLGDHFKVLFGEEKAFCIFTPMVLGLLQLLFSIFFLKSLTIDPERGYR